MASAAPLRQVEDKDIAGDVTATRATRSSEGNPEESLPGVRGQIAQNRDKAAKSVESVQRRAVPLGKNTTEAENTELLASPQTMGGSTPGMAPLAVLRDGSIEYISPEQLRNPKMQRQLVLSISFAETQSSGSSAKSRYADDKPGEKEQNEENGFAPAVKAEKEEQPAITEKKKIELIEKAQPAAEPEKPVEGKADQQGQGVSAETSSVTEAENTAEQTSTGEAASAAESNVEKFDESKLKPADAESGLIRIVVMLPEGEKKLLKVSPEHLSDLIVELRSQGLSVQLELVPDQLHRFREYRQRLTEAESIFWWRLSKWQVPPRIAADSTPDQLFRELQSEEKAQQQETEKEAEPTQEKPAEQENVIEGE